MSTSSVKGPSSSPSLTRTREANATVEAAPTDAPEGGGETQDARWNAPTASASKGASSSSGFQTAGTPKAAAQRLGNGIMETGRGLLDRVWGSSGPSPAQNVAAWGKAIFQDAKPAPASLDPMPSAKNDLPSDGKLMVQGPGGPGLAPRGTSLDALRGQAFTPKDGVAVKPGPVVLYTTGIQTNAASQAETAQLLANQGHNVIAVRNATEPSGGVFGGLGSTSKDAVQASADVSLGETKELGSVNPAKVNPATLTLAASVTQELREGRPVHLIGHSQGAAITAAALNVVNLAIETGQPKPEGLSDAQWQAQRDTMRQALSESKVETMGGFGTTFPPGPTYTHYINDGDHVPQTRVGGLLIGTPSPEDVVQRGGGDKATFHLFNDGNWTTDPERAHAVDKSYLAQRERVEAGRGTGTKVGQFVVDLKQARATLADGGFSKAQADELLKRPENALLTFGWNRHGFEEIVSRCKEFAGLYPQLKTPELVPDALAQGARKYGGQATFLNLLRGSGFSDGGQNANTAKDLTLNMDPPRGRDGKPSATSKKVTFTLGQGEVEYKP